MPLYGAFLILFNAVDNDLITALSICEALVDSAYSRRTCTGLTADLTEDRTSVEHARHLKSRGQINHFFDCCHIVEEFAAFLFIFESQNRSVKLMHVFLFFIRDHYLLPSLRGHIATSTKSVLTVACSIHLSYFKVLKCFVLICTF